jgi:hypothetical protein
MTAPMDDAVSAALEDTKPEAELLDAVIAVAAYPPLTHGPTTSMALVYWPTIERLRAALDAMGIEWKQS